MKTLALILTTLLITACGSSGQNASTSSGLSTKSLFSYWQDNGSGAVDYSRLSFGTTNLTQTLVGGGITLQCDQTITVTGSNDQGLVQVTRSVLVTTGVLSTVCGDIVGTYEYQRTASGMIIGRQGSSPIEYH